MSTRSNEPLSISTPTIERPNGTSYETICAAERRPPISEYLLFDAQPPRMMPYTPAEVSARISSRPMFTGVTVKAGGVGREDHDQADVHARDGEGRRRSERNQAEDEERGDERQHRPEEVRDFLRARRNDVFFQDELDRIGEDLTESPRPDAIRTEPRLHEPER